MSLWKLIKESVERDAVANRWRGFEQTMMDIAMAKPLEPPKPKRRKWGPDLERLSKESQRKRTRGYRID
jgi:hypothetical protein